MQTPPDELSVPRELQRGHYDDVDDWLESAVFLVELLQRVMSRDDLSDIDMLDVGCGTKLVKVLLEQSRAVGHYVGVDVHAPIIEWLQANVSDKRFAFHHFNAHNDRYNPAGIPLAQLTELPVDGHRFDLICLFSVFTHLAPEDYVAMLRLLRHHVNPDGRLVFSLFLTESDRHRPLEEAIRARLASDDPATADHARRAIAEAMTLEEAGFVDEVPAQPLLRARYTKAYAMELMDGTGWDVVSVNPPQRHIQHSMVCRPV